MPTGSSLGCGELWEVWKAGGVKLRSEPLGRCSRTSGAGRVDLFSDCTECSSFLGINSKYVYLGPTPDFLCQIWGLASMASRASW